MILIKKILPIVVCFLVFSFCFADSALSKKISTASSGQKTVVSKNVFDSKSSKSSKNPSGQIEQIVYSDSFQMVFPDCIYVGDEAELTYQFSSGIDLFVDLQNSDERSLISSALPFELETKDWSIKKLSVRKSGEDYVVSFIFVPWRPGMMKFPSFDINKAVFGTETIPLLIDTKPFEVSHIVSSDYEELGKQKAPYLVPGTIYAIVGIVFVIVLLFVCVVKVYSIRERIYSWILEKTSILKLSRNFRRTKRALKKLLIIRRGKKVCEDDEFCCNVQNILRGYLENRYGRSFKSIVTGKIAFFVQQITCSCLSDKVMSSIEEIDALFKRCDYIRFAKGSVESQKLPEAMFAARLMNGERMVIVEKALSLVVEIEGKKKSLRKKEDSFNKEQKDSCMKKSFEKPFVEESLIKRKNLFSKKKKKDNCGKD